LKTASSAFNVRSYLAVLPLFADLTDSERERFVQTCELTRLTRGDMLFRVGDPCEAFHVVVVGQIKLFVANADGHEKIIELIGPGNSFAEAFLFLEKPCFVNAQALADTLLVSISKASVFQEIERDPRLAMRMLAGISRRLHGLVQDVESYALHSGMHRLIGYLLRELEDSQTVSLPVSKSAIASRLSLTPEYFSRVLHELESHGLIAIDKRNIRILDVQRLARYEAH